MGKLYKSLGFKCGIECNQQLETHKLFCSCPSLVNDPNIADIKFNRKLKAVIGETGNVDIAAVHEMQKGKTFIYEACSSSSCLVEQDEEPIHQINEDALDTVLMIALLLKAKIVDGLLVYVKHIEYSGAESGKSVDVVLAETAESCPEDCVSEGIVKEFYKGIFIRFIRFFGG